MWLSNADFERLTSDAQILEQNLHGTKVLLRPDGRVVKLFRIKRLLSLALIYPYSLRFQRNAVRLRELGICAPEVEQLFFCPAVRRHGVVYPLLAGRTLEQRASDGEVDPDLLSKVAAFIARLHEKGIYFRSLHPGNILIDDQGDFSLIDVADLRFRRKPLSLDLRVRNFKHMLRRPNSREMIAAMGFTDFIHCYLDAATLSDQERQRFLHRAEERLSLTG